MSEVSENRQETVNFKRFLSYIYAYEDEKKLRNIGFVKAEIRYDRIRMQVAVSGLSGKGGKPLELCLVDDDLKRTPIGQVYLQNGQGEFRSVSGVENLWNSGLSFKEICGISLHGAGDQRYYYMTLWRERKKRYEEDVPVEQEAYDVFKVRECSQNPVEVQEDNCLERQENERLDTGKPSEAIVERIDDHAMESQIVDQMNLEVKPAINIEAEAVENISAKHEIDSWEKTTQLILHASEVRSDSPCIIKKNVDSCMKLWKKLCSRYPHVDIRPISLKTELGEEQFCATRRMCEALRIRPDDIGRLPRTNWVLAHNSFLQHAYNHNHHLILYRVECRQEESGWNSRWFLGIPGCYDEQERVVAEVFGLKSYMSCEKGGFWYTEINMG